MLGVAAQRIVHPIRKPRNNADEAIAPKPEGTGLSGRSALSRRSSRKAAVAATRDLFRGSLGGSARRMPSMRELANIYTIRASRVCSRGKLACGGAATMQKGSLSCLLRCSGKVETSRRRFLACVTLAEFLDA